MYVVDELITEINSLILIISWMRFAIYKLFLGFGK